MSTRALNRRSREAMAWLSDAMAPLWCQSILNNQGEVPAALGLNHRVADEQPPDGVATARLAAALLRVRRLSLDVAGLDERLEPVLSAIASRATASTDPAEPLLDRAANIVALTLSAEVGMAPPAGVAFGGWAYVDGAHEQAETLIAGQAFRASGLMTWLDACHGLARVDPEGGHKERANRLVAAITSFLEAAPHGLFARAGEPVSMAEQFSVCWRLYAHHSLVGEPVPAEVQTLHGTAYGWTNRWDGDEEARPQWVQPDGTVHAAGQSLDVQTAALLAHLQQVRAGVGEAAMSRAVASFDALMDTHITMEGGWLAAYDAQGQLLDQQIETRHADKVVRALATLIDTTAAW